MKKGYVLKTLVIFAIALLLVYGGFETVSFFGNRTENNLTPINISYAKTEPDIHQENLVQIEIAINDNPAVSYEKIEEAFFNRQVINLKKADKTGNRALTFLQVKPGNYMLSWKTKNSKHSFAKYSKSIQITEKDLWIHVLIKGAQITITN